MFCRACGAQLHPNVKFCHLCGQKVEPFLPPVPAAPPENRDTPVTPPAVENVTPAPEAEEVTPAPAAAPGFVTPPIPENPPSPPPAAPAEPQRKKGSHWVPIGIMTVLFAIGLGVFFLSQAFPPYTPPLMENENQSETPWFHMEDGELYFDNAAYEGPEEITVPSEVDGQTVTALAEGCFAGSKTLTTVILPDTLQVIGPEAFADCTSLRGIYIPDHVTVIGAGAFRGCTSLEAIDLPGTIVTIGYQAFEDCEKLEHIFFNGKKSQWKDLYSDKIGPNTQVYCTNGTLKQGRGKS